MEDSKPLKLELNVRVADAEVENVSEWNSDKLTVRLRDTPKDGEVVLDKDCHSVTDGELVPVSELESPWVVVGVLLVEGKLVWVNEYVRVTVTVPLRVKVTLSLTTLVIVKLREEEAD